MAVTALAAIALAAAAWWLFNAAVRAALRLWQRTAARQDAAHRARVIARDTGTSRVLPPGVSLSDAYRVAAAHGTTVTAAAQALHDAEVRARVRASVAPNPLHGHRRSITR